MNDGDQAEMPKGQALLRRIYGQARELCTGEPRSEKFHEINDLFLSGQFESVLDLYRRENLRLKPQHHAGQLVLRSALYLHLNGQPVSIDWPQPFSNWFDCVCARFGGDQSKARDLLNSLVDQTRSAAHLKVLYEFANFFGILPDEEAFQKLRAELNLDRKRERYDLTRRGEKLSFKTVFVSGVPRSGTTALGRLINLSPDIDLYHELYPAGLGYASHMFAPTIVNKRSEVRYPPEKRPAPNFNPDLPFRGDKRPLFMSGWHITQENFAPGDLKIIHIVRDPVAVAASYEKRRRRALHGKRNWPPDRGPLLAESDLQVNRSLVSNLLQNQYASALLIVPYEKALTDIETAKRIHAFIGTSVDEALLKEVLANNQRYIQRAESQSAKLRLLTPDDLDWYRRVSEA